MTERDSRNTPKPIADMVAEFFGGPVSLDPCWNAASVVATVQHFDGSEGQNGLIIPWWPCSHTAYVNGEWSNLDPWVEKTIEEYLKGCEILFCARTESATEWARKLNAARSAHVELHKRYCFPIEGQPLTTDTRPTSISYFGERVNRFAHVFRKHGDVYGRPL